MPVKEFPSISEHSKREESYPITKRTTKPTLCGCESLVSNDQRSLLHGGRVQIVEREQTLYWQRDEATKIFQVHDGIIILSANLMDGRRQVFRFCFAGDIFGLPANGEHYCTATAACTSTVSAHPLSILSEAGASGDFPIVQILRVFVRELILTRHQTMTLSRRSALEKIASFLLVLVERCGRDTEDGRHHIPLPIRHADIADHLGIAPETVCRFLTDFKRQGIIAAQPRGEFLIVDTTQLHLIVHGDTNETCCDR